TDKRSPASVLRRLQQSGRARDKEALTWCAFANLRNPAPLPAEPVLKKVVTGGSDHAGGWTFDVRLRHVRNHKQAVRRKARETCLCPRRGLSLESPRLTWLRRANRELGNCFAHEQLAIRAPEENDRLTILRRNCIAVNVRPVIFRLPHH